MKDLKRLLEEDTESSEDAAALLPLMQALQTWQAPEASTAELTHLKGRLLAELTHPRPVWQPVFETWFWSFLRAQLRIIRTEIWAASLLVMMIGVVVMLAQESSSTSPLAFFAPLASAGGIAFIYGPAVDPPLEILLAGVVSNRLILLARLLLVFGFNLALGIAASLALALLKTELSLHELILVWLAPMTFLSALAFALGVLTKEPLLGALTSLMIWFLQFVDVIALFRINLTDPSARPLLIILGLLLAGIALWLADSEEQWLGANTL